MNKALRTVRSALLWAVSGIHFGVVGAFLVFLGLCVDPRKNDWPQRLFFRNILRLAGAKLEVRSAPGFDDALWLHRFFDRMNESSSSGSRIEVA